MGLLAVESSTSSALSYWPIAVLGGLAMLVLAGLQYKRFSDGGRFSTSFMKGYGLILVATLGAVLVFADVSDSARTGAYTLLGTIAGYLAGTKPPSTGAGEDDKVPTAHPNPAFTGGATGGSTSTSGEREESLG